MFDKIKISKEHPWIGFHAGYEWQYVDKNGKIDGEDFRKVNRKLWAKRWELIPDDFKPYTTLCPILTRIKPNSSKERDYKYLMSVKELRKEVFETSEKNKIPLVPYVHLAFNSFSPLWCEESQISLKDLEKYFQKYNCIRGIKIVELGGECGFFSEDRDYLMGAIELASKYDKIVSFWDHANLWQTLLVDDYFIRHITKHSKTFIPFWEMNGAMTAYADQGMPFGLWASQTVSNWGVNPQAGWYWLEACYDKIWKSKQKNKFGNETAAPDALWAQMVMLGASAGATAYVFEGCDGWYWNFGEILKYDPGHAYGVQSQTWRTLPKAMELTNTFTKSIYPTLKHIIKNRNIPSRPQAQKKIKVAYQTKSIPDDVTPIWNPEMLRRINWASGATPSLDELSPLWRLPVKQKRFYMGHLYPATYGIESGTELFPKTSRYYWIPVVPRNISKQAAEKFTITNASQYKIEDEISDFFDKHYPDQNTGSAWVVDLSSAIYIMNSSDNRKINQDFKVSLSSDLFEEIFGSISPWTAMTVNPKKNRLTVFITNYIGKQQGCPARELKFALKGLIKYQIVSKGCGIKHSVCLESKNKQSNITLKGNGWIELTFSV